VGVHGNAPTIWVSEQELAAWRGATRGPFVLQNRYGGGHFDHHEIRGAIMGGGPAVLRLRRRSVDMTFTAECESIADVLWQRARHTPRPTRPIFFLDELGYEQDERSYASLARRSHAIARALTRVAEPGQSRSPAIQSACHFSTRSSAAYMPASSQCR